MKKCWVRWSLTLALAMGALTAVIACGAETEGRVVPLRITATAEPDEGRALGEFTTASGWFVQLTEARLGLAALYAYRPQRDAEPAAVAQLLDLLVPVAHAHGGFDPLNGRAVRAEHREPVALDLLADGEQPLGEVSAETGAIDELALELLGPSDDSPEELQGHSAWVAGEAERDGVTVRFAGGVDLREQGTTRRIESLAIGGVIGEGQSLQLRINPSRWLAGADFSRLAPPASEDEPSAITPEDQVGRAWYVGVRNPAAFAAELVEGEQP
jgi:hypothetical protein